VRRTKSTCMLGRRRSNSTSEVEAVDRLVDLIKEHGKWSDPEPVPQTN
jgi:hypothetical protein